MPTVLLWNGYRFYFFSNEGNEPPHIHVHRGGCAAKFWLENALLEYNDGFKHNEISKLRAQVTKNKQLFLEKWNEHLKRKN